LVMNMSIESEESLPAMNSLNMTEKVDYKRLNA
jgi:hypothetical protein